MPRKRTSSHLCTGRRKGTCEEHRRGAVAHEGPAEVVPRVLPVRVHNRECARLVTLAEVALRVILNRPLNCRW
eukprot:9466832-Pyramimonas_sp.AAC.1